MEKLNKIKITLGAAGLAAFSVFLPWIEITSSISFGGFNSSITISGIKNGGGFFGLLVALAGGYMVFKKIKFAFIAGALNFLIGLGYMLGWFDGGGSYTSSLVGISINPKFGLYLFILASIVFMIFTLKNFLHFLKDDLKLEFLKDEKTE